MAKGDKIGVCPLCGGDIVETDKAYGCNKWKESDGGCKFAIWKSIAHKDISSEVAQTLLEDKQTEMFDDFVSKKGTNFSAKLVLNDGKIDFEFKPKT